MNTQKLALDALKAMQSEASARGCGLRICDEAIEALEAEAVQVEPGVATITNLAAKLRTLTLNPQDDVFIHRAADMLDELATHKPSVQVEPVPASAELSEAVLEQTQILRDAADRLADNGYTHTGAEIRMAAKVIESAITRATPQQAAPDDPAHVIELGHAAVEIGSKAIAERDRLTDINAELVAALQDMVEIAELIIGVLPIPPDADGPLIKARAALAKVNQS